MSLLNVWNSFPLTGGPLSVFTTSGIPWREKIMSRCGITVLAEVHGRDRDRNSETARQTDRQTDRQRGRERDRDRETDRQGDRERQRQRDRDRERQRGRDTDRESSFVWLNCGRHQTEGRTRCKHIIKHLVIIIPLGA